MLERPRLEAETADEKDQVRVPLRDRRPQPRAAEIHVRAGVVLEKVARLRNDPEVVRELVDAVDDEAVEERVLVGEQAAHLDAAPAERRPEVLDDGRFGGEAD